MTSVGDGGFPATVDGQGYQTLNSEHGRFIALEQLVPFLLVIPLHQLHPPFHTFNPSKELEGSDKEGYVVFLRQGHHTVDCSTVLSSATPC